MFIGIIDIRENLAAEISGYFCFKAGRSYGLNFKFGKLRIKGVRGGPKCCKRSELGDVVEMCLDLNALELSYIINGKDCDKAFDVAAASYRAGSSLNAEKDGLELIGYDYIKRNDHSTGLLT